MNYIVKTDLFRHGGLKGFTGFILGWYQPGFRYTFIFRLLSMTKMPLLRFVLRLFKRRYRILYGYEIDSKAQIGEGFYLSDHRGSVNIGPASIGKNCNISHNVTIGRTYKNGVVGLPTLGDRVWIGAGAVLVGPINIGSDVLIAPNAYVNMDVPSHSLVLGNPASIYTKENPTRYYINYILPDNRR